MGLGRAGVSEHQARPVCWRERNWEPDRMVAPAPQTRAVPQSQALCLWKKPSGWPGGWGCYGGRIFSRLRPFGGGQVEVGQEKD